MKRRTRLDVIREFVVAITGVDPSDCMEQDEAGQYLDLTSKSFAMVAIEAAQRRDRENGDEPD